MDPLTLAATGTVLSVADNIFDFSGSKALQKKQLKIAQGQLELEQKRVARQEAIFGSTEDNLKHYYDSLDPNKLIAQRTQEIQKQYQISNQNLQQNLAKHGLDTSGIMAQATIQNEFNRATSTANATSNIDAEIAQQRQSFLSIGMGAKQQAYAGERQASTNLANVYGNQAQIAQQNQQSLYNDLGSIANAYGKSSEIEAYKNMSADEQKAYNSFNSRY